MNVDTKFPTFRSYMSDNKLNNGGVKTTINQSAVSAGEQTNVDLNLSSEEEKSESKKSKSKKKNKTDLQANKKENDILIKKSDAEVKSINMKLLNLL